MAVIILVLSCCGINRKARRNQTTHLAVIGDLRRQATRRFHRVGAPVPPPMMPQAMPQAMPQMVPQMVAPAIPEVQAVELVQPTVPAMMPAMSYGVGQPADQSNPTEELERLASLHASGALSDAEFEQAKAKVLGLDGGAMPMGQPMAPMAQPMAFGAFGGLLGQGQVPIAQAV